MGVSSLQRGLSGCGQIGHRHLFHNCCDVCPKLPVYRYRNPGITASLSAVTGSVCIVVDWLLVVMRVGRQGGDCQSAPPFAPTPYPSAACQRAHASFVQRMRCLGPLPGLRAALGWHVGVRDLPLCAGLCTAGSYAGACVHLVSFVRLSWPLWTLSSFGKRCLYEFLPTAAQSGTRCSITWPVAVISGCLAAHA